MPNIWLEKSTKLLPGFVKLQLIVECICNFKKQSSILKEVSTHLIIISLNIWNIHVVSRRANIFIFFASENINSNKVNLTKKGEQETCLIFAKYITHYIQEHNTKADHDRFFLFPRSSNFIFLKKNAVVIELRSSEQLNNFMTYQDPISYTAQ